jgi:putative ABC transport system ATP-binding protein
MPAAIEISGLTKRYGVGDAAVDALKGVDMTVQPGEVVGLIGPSGSGKSTLLKCLGAVIEPSAGRMALAGEAIYNNGWQVADLPALRRDRIGFVFQAPYLIPFLNVTDNVALLPMLAGVSNASAREQARAMLAALDVGHRSQARVAQLSGGEQQRVAIARALVNQPPIILADEPTAPPGQRARIGCGPHPQRDGTALLRQRSSSSPTTKRSSRPSGGFITSVTDAPMRKPAKGGRLIRGGRERDARRSSAAGICARVRELVA